MLRETQVFLEILFDQICFLCLGNSMARQRDCHYGRLTLGFYQAGYYSVSVLRPF